MSFAKTAGNTGRKTRTPLIAFLVIVIAVVAVVAATILTQTVPTSPPIGGEATTTSTCNSSTSSLSYPATIPAGPATVVLQCGSNPAFSVPQGGPDTPTFTFPAVGVVPTSLEISTTVTCASPITLTSGTQVTLGQTSYYYCLSYSATTGTINSFSISWSS